MDFQIVSEEKHRLFQVHFGSRRYTVGTGKENRRRTRLQEEDTIQRVRAKRRKKMNAAIKPRHEWKYVVSRMEYLAIRQRIRTLMQSDPHAGPDGTYRIRSVYFDDPDDHAL